MSRATRRRTRAAWIFLALGMLAAIAALALWFALGAHLAVWIATGVAAFALVALLVLGVWWAIARALAGVDRPRRTALRAWRLYLRAGLKQAYASATAGAPRRVFLVVGPAGHGKSALLRAGFARDELERVAAPPAPNGADGLICWRATAKERGASGLFVETRGGGDTGHRAALSHLLSAARRERLPIRGALVCISAESLLAPDGALPAVQDVLQVVQEAMAALELRLPVELVVTKLDRIAGVAELFAELSDAERPHLIALSARRGSFDEDARAWSDWLRQRRFAALIGGDAKKTTLDDPDARERRAGLYTLSAQMERLFEAARRVAEALRGGSEVHVRSIFFVAAEVPETDEVPLDRVLEALLPVHGLSRRERPRVRVPSSARALLRTALADHSEVPSTAAAIRGRKLRWRASAAVASTALLYSGVQVFGAARLNHDLLQGVVDDVAGARAATQPLASPAGLGPLAVLQQRLAQLEQYAEDGPPRALRWGLFQGNEVHGETEVVFRELVRARIVRPIVQRMEEKLQAFAAAYEAAPDSADATDHELAYERLRTYLLLTDERGRLAQERGLADRLARYGDEVGGGAIGHARLSAITGAYLQLTGREAWGEDGDAALIARVRGVLRRTEHEERALARIIAEVSRAHEQVSLRKISTARVFKDDSPAVEGALTRSGWSAVYTKLSDARDGEEPWVLGLQEGDLVAERTARAGRMAEMYARRYADAWYNFFRQVELGGFEGFEEAHDLFRRLTQTGQEPLLALWESLAANTLKLEPAQALLALPASEPPERREARMRLAARFTSLIRFGLPDETAGDKKATETELAHYHERLREVHAAIGAALEDPAAISALKTAVDKAIEDTRTAVESNQLADEWRQPLLKLLLTPLRALEQRIKTGEGCQVTDQWRTAVIDPLSALVGKYPFTHHPTLQVTMDEVAALFHPETGAIAAFRDQQLARHVIVSGDTITASPSGKKSLQLDPAALDLLNQSLRIGRALFAGDKPGVAFRIMLGCKPTVGDVSLTLDGVFHKSRCRQEDIAIVWPGEGDKRGATAAFGHHSKVNDKLYGEGEWGLWKLLEKPQVRLEASQTQLLIDFNLTTSGRVRWELIPEGPGGRTLALGPRLLAPFREPVFARLPRRLFAGMTCPERGPR